MKVLLASIIAFSTFTINAQSDSTTKGTWLVGGIFSPQYAYRTLKAADNQRWQADALDTLESQRYAYSTGIVGGHSIGKNGFLELSLLFTDKGQQIKQIGLWRNYTDHYYFLDVPVSFRYNMLGKRSKFADRGGRMPAAIFASAGLNTSILLYSRTTYTDPAKTEKQSLAQTTQLSPVHFGVVAGLGVSSPISEQIDFRLTIAYRRALTATSNTPLQRQFWSLGADMGFTYSF